jgi:mono/diheme cytochrome c family protein
VLLDYRPGGAAAGEQRGQLADRRDLRQVELGTPRDQSLRLLQHTTSRVKARSIGTDLSRGQQARHAPLAPHHRRAASSLGWFPDETARPRIFDRAASAAARQAADAELRSQQTKSSADHRDHELPARNSAPGRDAGARRGTTSSPPPNAVHRRNCVGCHIVEGDGGDFIKLVADPSLGPPLLTPEGARVQHDWLYAFLRGPITIRPWLSVRMPTFGLDDQNLNGVINYFGSISNSMEPFQTHELVRTANTEGQGKPLFELLKCQQCHVLGTIPKDQPTSNLATDLRMSSERLQPAWIKEWLKKPSDIAPGTRMPAFWPDYPKSPYPAGATPRRRSRRSAIPHYSAAARVRSRGGEIGEQQQPGGKGGRGRNRPYPRLFRRPCPSCLSQVFGSLTD